MEHEGFPPAVLLQKNITLLNLGSIQLQGMLLKELSNLHELVGLKLQLNHVKGAIPHKDHNLKKPDTMTLSTNSASVSVGPPAR